MLLPNEALFGVLVFADFNALISAKFVDARFSGILTANEHLLTIQRRFWILITNAYISCEDITNGTCRKSVRYERANHQSFAVACRELGEIIGQHAVVKTTFSENTCVMPGVVVIFEHVPALKFSENVVLNIHNHSQTGWTPEVFMWTSLGSSRYACR
ncbi:hypothetical protein AAVH_18344 [Aphelenchoides avenae]|nr:hypothetical protein AAVH_18344 [Aphelenchus avenae]